MANNIVKTSENWIESEATLVLPETISIDVLAEVLKQNKWLLLPVKKVDFSKVTKADSAILAVLLIWSANVTDKLKIIQLPEELKTLITLYGLEDVIELV
ncbi:hypothetical protein JCM30760_06450 [Thiomicrorhabdus hydrogeniphila]